MWEIGFKQINSCNVSFSCRFAQDSTADGCLIQWRLNGSNETIGNLFLWRSASEDNITVTQLSDNVFRTNITYIAEAVGISNGQPTDMLMPSIPLTVKEEAGVECFPFMSKSLHGFFVLNASYQISTFCVYYRCAHSNTQCIPSSQY